ncbi:MAG TPA: arylesterase, partial [Chromatiales bacterium]|nr:arylesterase [Chromatiales bacterium]
QRLQREGYPHRVVNASISGETSSGALARLPRELDIHAPHIVLIELGGNDGLRGLSLETLEANLAAMIKMVLDRGAKPLLIGMRLPPNYGPTFTRRFAALFPALARRYDIPLVPFLLEGLATKRAFFQADGIHPNAAAQPLILDNVWSRLRELL